MLQLTKKPSRCQGIWGQTVSLGLCERTHMRDPIWHLSLLSHQRHNRMLRNRNFHARTLTRTWIRRQLRKWLQAALPKSYKPADKTEQQEAITDFTQERCRCCLGGTERNVFWGGWRILQQDRKHNWARAWKADGGKSLPFGWRRGEQRCSPTGCAERPPCLLQSWEIPTSSNMGLNCAEIESWRFSSQPVLAAGTPADRVGTVAGTPEGEKAGPAHVPSWPQ